jgi:hypothetical protein
VSRTSYKNEPNRILLEVSFIGSDGTRWRKRLGTGRNVRTRADNIITQLAGEKSETREKKTPTEVWNQFIINDMLKTIVV